MLTWIGFLPISSGVHWLLGRKICRSRRKSISYLNKKHEQSSILSALTMEDFT